MRGLKGRVAKIEEARRGRRGEEPYVVKSDDSRAEAKVTPLPGRPPSVTIRYDASLLDPEAARALIEPFLPRPLGAIYCFPREMEEEEWEEWTRETELVEQREETQNPTLH